MSIGLVKTMINSGNKYITVIGGANVDITGFPNDRFVLKDSNPGKVKVSLGGVGRNISENLVKLGMNTKLISVVGDDLYGKKILDECNAIGIDMSDSLILKDTSSSVYLSILDEQRDMNVAISHMDILDKINIDYIKSKSYIINNSKLVVVDTNLSKEVIEYLLTSFEDINFFLDPVSTEKAKKVKDLIGNCHTIKPNRLEAEILANMKINDIDDLKKASEIFLEKGVRKVFISLGKDGVFYNDGKDEGLLSLDNIDVVNATGAGDAFMASIVYSFIKGSGIQESAKYGMAAATLALSHEETINPNMSEKNLIKKMEEI
ncbi:carbohydrate kinase family protein [Sporosalibacterium faouarense]|uniref:carbohydrate kinase family protein n=1 Tax=Sporosalibacterium faouarense TaxID=516123 RepID=UPI00192A9E7F|nr:carbohydrate kinase family protein [Sporosalibacterium faouarense]